MTFALVIIVNFIIVGVAVVLADLFIDQDDFND